MLKNYLKVALRTLRRNKGYTAINVGGLAVGIACCTLIFLFARSELSVNASFPDAGRTYRVDSDWRKEEMGLTFATLAPASAAMQRVFPDVEARTRMWGINLTLGTGSTWLRREAFVVDPSFPVFFDLPVVSGRAALPGPRSAMIRADLARALFGTRDAGGHTFQIKTWRHGTQTYTVSGVWEPLPRNSVTQFGGSSYEVLLPHANEDFTPAAGFTSWQSRYIIQFVKLAPETRVQAFQKKLAGFVEQHAPAELRSDLRLVLNPLSSLYLTDEDGRGRRVVTLLAVVGALILLIACANFVNLTTARSLTRAREVGVRRAAGALRRQVAGQFMLEALLISTAAALVGAALARLTLVPFVHLLGKQLVLANPWDGWTLLALAGVVLFVSAAAGAYPAFSLTRHRPADVLSGGHGSSEAPGGAWLRRGLVAGQFAVAVALIAGVIVVERQMSFMLGQDLGFAQENVLVIDSVERDPSQAGLRRMETVKARLRNVPGVQDVSLSASVPGNRGIVGGSGSSVAWRRPGWPDERAVQIGFERVDDDFPATYDLNIKRGRFFSDERAADTSRVVLNEAAAHAFGIAEAPVGKQLRVDSSRTVTVAGVVENYHQGSLHVPIQPLALVPVRASPFYKYLSVRLAAGTDLSEAVEHVRGAWAEVLPTSPFHFQFIEEKIERAYRTERRTRRVASIAAGLAIVLACLGLFGLAAFAAERRRKEIAVRKTFGASTRQLVALLSKDFLKLVAIGFVVAAPVAYFAMQHWLDGFAYRIELGPLVFLAAGALALVVALVAAGTQALRAARTNPAQALRDE